MGSETASPRLVVTQALPSAAKFSKLVNNLAQKGHSICSKSQTRTLLSVLYSYFANGDVASALPFVNCVSGFMFENGPNDQLLDSRRGQSLEFLRPYFMPISSMGPFDAPLLGQHNPKLGAAFARFLAWYFLQLSPAIRLPAPRRTLSSKLSNANVKPIPSLVLLMDLSRQLFDIQSRSSCASEFSTGASRPDEASTLWLTSASQVTSADNLDYVVSRESFADSMRLTQLDPQYCFDLLVHCQLLEDAALFALLNSNPLSSLVLDATVHIADSLLDSNCQKMLQKRLEKLAAKASLSRYSLTLAQCTVSGPNVLLALCVQQVENAVAASVGALDQSSDCHRQLVCALRAFARLANSLFALDILYFLAFYLSARLRCETTRLLQSSGPLVSSAVYLPQPPLFCPQGGGSALATAGPSASATASASTGCAHCSACAHCSPANELETRARIHALLDVLVLVLQLNRSSFTRFSNFLTTLLANFGAATAGELDEFSTLPLLSLRMAIAKPDALNSPMEDTKSWTLAKCWARFASKNRPVSRYLTGDTKSASAAPSLRSSLASSIGVAAAAAAPGSGSDLLVARSPSPSPSARALLDTGSSAASGDASGSQSATLTGSGSFREERRPVDEEDAPLVGCFLGVLDALWLLELRDRASSAIRRAHLLLPQVNDSNFGDWLESACIPCVLALERLVLQLRTHCSCEHSANSSAAADGLDASASVASSSAQANVEDADPEADSSAAAATAPSGCSECALAALADSTLSLLLAQLAEFAPDRLLCEVLAMHSDAAADTAHAAASSCSASASVRHTQRQRATLVQSLRGLSLGGGGVSGARAPAERNDSRAIPNDSDSPATPKEEQPEQRFDSKSLANHYNDLVPELQLKFADLQSALADRSAAALSSISLTFRSSSSASAQLSPSHHSDSDSQHSLLKLHHLEPEFADYLRMFAKISESVLERVLGADRSSSVAEAEEPNSVDEALELLSSWSCDVRSLRLARVDLPDLARTLATVETLSEHLMARDLELEHADLLRKLQPACACRNPLLATLSQHCENQQQRKRDEMAASAHISSDNNRAAETRGLVVDVDDRFLQRFAFGIKLEVDLRRALDAASGREATALLTAPPEQHTPMNESLVASSGSTGSLASAANARLTPLNFLLPASPSPRTPSSPLGSVRSRESANEECTEESPPPDDESTLHP